MKRKNAAQHDNSAPSKRACFEQSVVTSTHPVLKLLQQYYKHAGTLRQFLIFRLGHESKRRRRNLFRGLATAAAQSEKLHDAAKAVLDQTLVGWNDVCSVQAPQFSAEMLHYHKCCPTRDSVSQALMSQREILDFCLWRHRTASSERSNTKHVLFDQLSSAHGTRVYEQFTGPEWTSLPAQISSNHYNVLVDLFTECAVFSQSLGDNNNVVQISGPALNDLSTRAANAAQSKAGPTIDPSRRKQQRAVLSPAKNRSSMIIERYRVLYAVPRVTRSGRVRFGLSTDNVMNHTWDSARSDLIQAIFMSQKSTLEMPLVQRGANKPMLVTTSRLPRRLKGEIARRFERVQRRHRCTSYETLLDHYCVKVPDDKLSNPMRHFTPDSNVAAFARAVVLRVFGKQLFGSEKNWQSVARKIDNFLRLRRHEHISLHELLEGINVSDMKWLAPDNATAGQKLSLTDFEKRKQLLSDFMLFLFSSFLVDLIRTNFYVTESSLHRNRLLYFRHDIWRALSLPAIASMRASMLQKCDKQIHEFMSTKSALGSSRVRFVPKDSGMRPIVNLRGKPITRTNGTQQKGRSINKVLAPAFHALTYEKTSKPSLVGSAVFSVEEIYPKLRDFRQRLFLNGREGRPLYFARLDIKSCFDSLPQDRLLEVARQVLQHDTYLVSKYASGRLLGTSKPGEAFQARPVWQYKFEGSGTNVTFDIDEKAASGGSRAQAILVDLATQRRHPRSALLRLLEEHISGHLVELGGDMYHQRRGIAQGSIVSAILCSLLYTALESDVLGVIDSNETMLVRLIDDFLLISTRQSVAEQFMRTMHAGLPEFGVEVKLKKSLTNFEIIINDYSISALPQIVDFPFCGQTIHTVSLDFGRDSQRKASTSIIDSMTIDYSKSAGNTFQRRTMQALRAQMKKMLVSTSYNSIAKVRENISEILSDVAERTYLYLRSLSSRRQPNNSLLTNTIRVLTKLVWQLFRRVQTETNITRGQDIISATMLHRMVLDAYIAVFSRRQTQHGVLLQELHSMRMTGHREPVKQYLEVKRA